MSILNVICIEYFELFTSYSMSIQFERADEKSYRYMIIFEEISHGASDLNNCDESFLDGCCDYNKRVNSESYVVLPAQCAAGR